MSLRFFFCVFVFLCCSACEQQHQDQHKNATQESAPVSEEKSQLSQAAMPVPSVLLPAANAVNSLTAIKAADQYYWLTASAERGIAVHDINGTLLSSSTGRYEFLSARAAENTVVVASTDIGSGDVVLFSFNPQQQTLDTTRRLQPLKFQIDALCLYKDAHNNLFLFLIDGYGGGEQRWIYDAARDAEIDLHVKGLHLPADISSCVVHDEAAQVFYAEENLGLWAYPANAESEPERELVATRPGFKALALVNNYLFAVTENTGNITLFQKQEGSWSESQNLQTAQHYTTESLEIIEEDETLRAAFVDDNTAQVLQFDFAKSALNKNTSSSRDFASTSKKKYPEVYAKAETDAVTRRGDAADDPAIWHNEQNPAESRILGTNKKLGLLVYNLKGELLQTLPVGHVNNVDLRQNFKSENTSIDIAVASNRSDNSIDVFTVTQSGEVRFSEKFSTGLSEVYGICLYQPASDKLFVLINDKDGRYQQYQVVNENTILKVKRVQEFKLEGQPEACVADDRRHLLYVGEEDKGVWHFAFDHTTGIIQPQSALLIAEAGAELEADVEGLGLYHAANTSYLLVSSQGDNSYALYDVSAHSGSDKPPYLGSFRVGLNSNQGIDGTTETDGLEVSTFNFGPDYPEGLVVIQDGFNLMPEEPQNFKLVSWQDIKKVIKILP